MCCFPELYTRSGNTWKLAKKADFASLKPDTDKSLLRRLYMFHWLKS